jgi:hypothetical protein
LGGVSDGGVLGAIDPVSDFGIDDDVSGVVLPLAGGVIGGDGGGGVDEPEGAVEVGGVLGGSDGVGVLLHATSVAQAATSNACETFMRILILLESALLPKHKSTEPPPDYASDASATRCRTRADRMRSVCNTSRKVAPVRRCGVGGGIDQCLESARKWPAPAIGTASATK